MGARTFTFLHAADLHLDSALHGLRRYAGAPAERLRTATRGAFMNLVDAARERAVAFVVIAGDVFDGELPDYNAALWFTAEVRRLTEAGIPLVLLRGNHDAESQVTKRLHLPPDVHEFRPEAASTVRLPGLDVALHGQSFAVPHVQENLARGYPPPVPGVLNVGVLHTGLEGYEGHGRYAPCTAEDLRAKGYDYWALGHVHQREVLSRAPWIVFPGNLQGRHARELGPKGATLVHVDDGRVVDVEPLELDVARWVHVVLDLTGVASEDAALHALGAALERELDDAGGRLVAARVTFSGETPLDAHLHAEPQRFESQVRAVATGRSADLWIERVIVDTRASVRRTADADGLPELAERLRSATLAPETAAELAKELGRLSDRLARAGFDALRPSDPQAFAEAAEPAARHLAALLEAATSAEGGADT